MVTKVALGKYVSDLLPGAEFESIEEARHYDKREAMRLSGGKDKFNGQFDPAPSELSQVHDLVRHAMAEAADAAYREEGGEIVEQFLEQTPDLVRDGEQGIANAYQISGWCKAKGILQATVYDLQRAAEDLRALNALYLKPIKR